MTSTSSASTTRAEIDLRALLLSILRNLPLLLLASALVAAAVFFVLGRVTPVYRAEARLTVEVDETKGMQPRYVLDSEAQLIRSRGIGLAVISELGLAAVPEYRRAIEGGGLFRDIRVALGLARDLSDATEEERILDHYDESLAVRPLDGASVIVIAFEAEDPELAARVANAIAEAYLALRQSATAETAAMLDAEIDRVRSALAEAERRAAALRDELAGLPPPQTGAERDSLAAELKAAEEAAGSAEASARAIRAALAGGKTPDATAFLDDPAVRTLTEEQRTLRSELAREMATNPLGNPRVAEIRVRLAQIETELRSAAERLAAALELSADRDRTASAELARRLAALDAATAVAAELSRMEAEIADHHERLAAIEKRRDVLKESGILPGDVRLLSRAGVPEGAVWPDRLFWMVVAFFGTLALGIVIVLVRGIDREQAVARAPFEPLAEMGLPEPAAARFRRVEEDVVSRAPTDEPRLAPAPDRSGATLATVADSITGQRRVVVTLAEDSDSGGRPLVAVALARALAGRDRSVVLLDLREDGANGIAMGEAPGLPGFAELLSGQVSFAQVIFPDRRSRAHFISAGAEPVQAEALAGERLATLLAALDHTYDHVVFDCPDDVIGWIAPGADAALVASEHASADPRTVRAVSRVAKISEARIFHLKVEPGRRPSDPDPEHAAAA